VRTYSKLLFGETAPTSPAEETASIPSDPGPQDDIAHERRAALEAISHDFSTRFGDGRARVKAIAVRDADHRLTSILSSGDDFVIRVHVDVEKALDEIVLGVFVKDRLGRIVTSTTTQCFGEEQRIRALSAGAQFVVELRGKMTLSAGYFFLG